MADTDSASSEVASQLIAGLAGEGDFVADKRFSLDPHKAREKLRSYQLEDPHAYVLLVVEAAYLAGDRSVDFSCGQTTQASFEGLSLTRSELENVFNAVFADTRALEGRARQVARFTQLLGIAANAALALGPSALEIENVDAQGQLNRLTILPDAEIRCEAEGEGPPSLTRFVFRGPREDQRDDREVELLRARCRYTEMVVNVYGRQISAGHRAALLHIRTQRIKLDGQTIGRAGMTKAPAAKLLLVTRGVLSETLPLPKAAAGFVAVVESDLRKDLSQSAVIRDEAFARVLSAVEAIHASLTHRSPHPLL